MWESFSCSAHHWLGTFLNLQLIILISQQLNCACRWTLESTAPHWDPPQHHWLPSQDTNSYKIYNWKIVTCLHQGLGYTNSLSRAVRDLCRLRPLTTHPFQLLWRVLSWKQQVWMESQHTFCFLNFSFLEWESSMKQDAGKPQILPQCWPSWSCNLTPSFHLLFSFRIGSTKPPWAGKPSLHIFHPAQWKPAQN